MSAALSAIVMTKNEEANIAACLATLRDFEQVFVVDSESEDSTVAIAQGLGAEVVQFTWDGRYPKKKQWCLDNLPFRHDLVLYVDADERVPSLLATEIAEIASRPSRLAGYFVGYDYVFLGRRLQHAATIYKLVLLDRRRAEFREWHDLQAENMWEVEGHYQPVVDGPVGRLRERMLHQDHDSLFHYFDRHNRYSDWEAVVAVEGSGRRGEETQLPGRGALKRGAARMPARPLLAFVESFVLRRGFLDGREGFDYALARAFYFWQIGLKTRELRARRKGA